MEAKPVLTSEVLQKELFTYYAGLSKARLGNPNLDTSKFSVNVRKMKQFEKNPNGALNVASYTATVNWIEPLLPNFKRCTLNYRLGNMQDRRTSISLCALHRSHATRRSGTRCARFAATWP